MTDAAMGQADRCCPLTSQFKYAQDGQTQMDRCADNDTISVGALPFSARSSKPDKTR